MNLVVDPNYKPSQPKPPKYLIERKEMDLAELRIVARETNEAAGEDIFDLDEIDKIEEDFVELRRKEQQKAAKGLSQWQPVSKRVELREFWGDIIDKDGLEVEKNKLVVVANKKYQIRYQDNPFSHEKPPYDLTAPLVYPHRGCVGNSLVVAMAKLNYTFNNIVNMLVDNLNFTVNKVFEYQSSDVVNAKQLTAIYPGKLIPTNTNQQALREVITSQVGGDVYKTLEILGKEMQEGTSVTEFIQGMPGEKAKTLGEIEIKTAESRGMFDTIAKGLEQGSIKRILEMTYDLYAQFGDYPPREGYFRFSVGGLSLMVTRRQKMQYIERALEVALSQPELAQRTDIEDLWRKFLSSVDLSDVYQEQAAGASIKPTTDQMDIAKERGVSDAKEMAGQVLGER
jgi:hypothetical protein